MVMVCICKGVGDRQVGIYVKKVVDGTPAATDGRLATGDQLLSVNGHSLIGISQEEAAQIMSRSGPDVHFEVRKGAAYRNGLVPWLTLHTQTVPSSSNPSSLSASMHSPTQNGRYNPPPAYPMQKYGSQQSVQSNIPPPSYQKHQQITASRSSAFAPPTAIQGQNGHPQNQFDFGTRHVRSISASDLYQGQNDPNASFSQRSITSTTGNGNFDKLPAHYRASNRPMVIQPGRPCPSPSSLRRAQSPSSLYRPPSVNGLNRPPSASELFAPPRSPNPLQMVGYSSNNRESHTQDLYRASMPSPPAAQSSPRASSEGFRPLPYSASASLPQPIFQKPTYQPLGGNHTPKAFVGPTTSGYQGQRQEPAIVRPVDVNIAREYERDTERQTTFGVIKGAVPTAITQALQLQQQQGGAPRVVVRAPRQSGVELDVRELERTNIALMSQDAVNDELDRLDAKGINMTESETMRYRELLNAAADQSRTQRHSLEPQPAVAQHINGHNSSSQNGQSAAVSRARVETLIDDVSTSVQARTNMRENISPGENRKKSVQFKDEEIRNEFDHINDGVLNSPAVIGTHEFYKDPRARRLNELQERQEQRSGNDGTQLGFRDKMRMFAHQIGENTPKQKIAASSAERHIANEQ